MLFFIKMRKKYFRQNSNVLSIAFHIFTKNCSNRFAIKSNYSFSTRIQNVTRLSRIYFGCDIIRIDELSMTVKRCLTHRTVRPKLFQTVIHTRPTIFIHRTVGQSTKEYGQLCLRFKKTMRLRLKTTEINLLYYVDNTRFNDQNVAVVDTNDGDTCFNNDIVKQLDRFGKLILCDRFLFFSFFLHTFARRRSEEI